MWHLTLMIVGNGGAINDVQESWVVVWVLLRHELVGQVQFEVVRDDIEILQVFFISFSEPENSGLVTRFIFIIVVFLIIGIGGSLCVLVSSLLFSTDVPKQQKSNDSRAEYLVHKFHSF